MKLKHLTVLFAFAASQAFGADTEARSSPLDTNPACMERTTDASTGKCVPADEGSPRHVYPPKSTAAGKTGKASSTVASRKKTVSNSGGGK